MALPTVIQYRILGPVRTRSADGRWGDLPQDKLRTLVATLLVRANRMVSRTELTAQLWPEEAPDSQRKLVQHYVYRLRRILGDPRGEVLRTRPGGYELRVQPEELDAELFDRLCVEGRQSLDAGSAGVAMDSLGRAMALWRGPALVDVPAAPAIVAEGNRLNERRLAATEMWLRAGLACGRHDQLIPELETLVAVHPLREHFRELLMTALYETGRQADALRACRDLRHTLREELGIDPGAGIQQLERTILLGEPVNLPLVRRCPGVPARVT